MRNQLLQNIFDVVCQWEKILKAEQKRLNAKEYLAAGMFDFFAYFDSKRYQKLEKARFACEQIKKRINAHPDEPAEEVLPRQFVAELFPRGLMSVLYLLCKSPSGQKRKTFCALSYLGEVYFCQ